MKEPTKIRKCCTMAIAANPNIYLTGCTEKSVTARDEDIRIRFEESPGFVPAWMFLRAMRFALSPREQKTLDTRFTNFGDDEYEYRSGPVTVRFKKFDVRVAMRVSVYLREHDATFARELDSATCTELERRIAEMRSTLYGYDPSKELPEIADDESRWFESFDRSNDRRKSVEIDSTANAPESAA